MQTREGVWENSKVCVNRAAGYVNTASVLYFFYKIYDKDSATETATVPIYLNSQYARTFTSKYTHKNHCYSPQFPSI